MEWSAKVLPHGLDSPSPGNGPLGIHSKTPEYKSLFTKDESEGHHCEGANQSTGAFAVLGQPFKRRSNHLPDMAVRFQILAHRIIYYDNHYCNAMPYTSLQSHARYRRHNKSGVSGASGFPECVGCGRVPTLAHVNLRCSGHTGRRNRLLRVQEKGRCDRKVLDVSASMDEGGGCS